MGIKTLASDTIKEAISEGVTIVDFWAEWCGPCKILAPVLEDLSDKYEGTIGVAKVNVSENIDLARERGISSIPCLVVFHDGKEVDRVVGFNGKDSLEDLFIKHS